jgi:hypothetical protein
MFATGPIFRLGFAYFTLMETLANPRVISADKMDGGVVVSFDDGMTALYSASLLRAMLPQAKQMNDADLGEQRS